MLEIEIIQRKGINVIDSKLLHKKLEVASYHADWIRRRIENYGFIENKDYYVDRMKNRNAYFLKVDTAKEFCILENNWIGKKTRNQFIKSGNCWIDEANK